MIALISALWILGGSATIHELNEWLEYEDQKSMRRLVSKAVSEGFVTSPGRNGRRIGLVKLTLNGWALLCGKFETPEIKSRMETNRRIFEMDGANNG